MPIRRTAFTCTPAVSHPESLHPFSTGIADPPPSRDCQPRSGPPQGSADSRRSPSSAPRPSGRARHWRHRAGHRQRVDAQSARGTDRDDDPTGRPGLLDTDLEPDRAARSDDADLGSDVSDRSAAEAARRAPPVRAGKASRHERAAQADPDHGDFVASVVDRHFDVDGVNTDTARRHGHRHDRIRGDVPRSTSCSWAASHELRCPLETATGMVRPWRRGRSEGHGG